MFRIRKEQLDHLGRRSQEEFVQRMASYLRSDFPADTVAMTDEALVDWVRARVDTAVAFGITPEPEVAQYLLLCLPLGERAPEVHSWFGAVLQRKDLDATGKVRELVRETRERWPVDVGPYVMPSMEAA